MICALAMIALAVFMAGGAGAARAAKPKPSAFVEAHSFCSTFDTKTLAQRFSVKPTKAAVSNVVARWLEGKIKHDPPPFKYQVRYRSLLMRACLTALR